MNVFEWFNIVTFLSRHHHEFAIIFGLIVNPQNLPNVILRKLLCIFFNTQGCKSGLRSSGSISNPIKITGSGFPPPHK